MVLRHGKQLDVAAVGDREDRELLALEKRLDDDRPSGRSERAGAEHGADRVRGFARVAQTTAPLPAARPEAFTTSGSGCRST